MKKYQIFLSAVLIPLDWILFFAAFVVARLIRQYHDLIPGLVIPPQTISFSDLIFFGILGATLFIIIQALSAGYTFSIRRSWVQVIRELSVTLSIWFAAFIAIIYLGNGFLYTIEIPRLVILFTVITAAIFLLLARTLLHQMVKICMRYHLVSTPVVGICSWKNITESSYYQDSLGYEVRYYTVLELVQQIPTRELDLILIPADTSSKDTKSLLRLARVYGIAVELLQISAEYVGHASINTDGEFPVTQVTFIRISVWGRIIKRVFDILGSVVLLVILSPILILIYLAIKFDDPGAPAIYHNRRIGKDGVPFTLYKFRYMKWELSVKDAYGVAPESDMALKYEAKLRASDQNSRSGPIYKITHHDPRHTRIGSVIERYSLDELPQLINVIIGNMSLVWPRPHQPREVENYDEWHKQVLTIKPGITGMAQVFARETPDFDREVELDISYIEQWTILLDFWLLINTLRVVIIKRHG